MSFSKDLSKAVDNIIHAYIQNIAEKYNLDPNDLLKDWENSENIEDKSTPTSSKKELDPNYLIKCLKPELVKLCKERGLKCTGTKTDLIAILQGGKVSSKNNTPKKSSEKKTNKKPLDTCEVLSKIQANIPVVAIRKNAFGNLEDPRTSLVFDRKSKKVIGKQNSNGTVEELTKEDIDVCNKEKYEYILPTNFDKDLKLEDEHVEELEEEFEEEEFEEEELIEDEEEIEEDEEEEFICED